MARWDHKTAIAASFREQHPDFVPFGEFVEECTEIVRPFEEPEKEWPVYGVNNQSGVFFSHWQRGEQFNSSYKRIKKDWFFHNPTRVNVGSIGRVPEVESEALTSPEYQVWRLKDNEWFPEFVEILIKMPFFNELVQVHRVGAVKQRLYAQNMMDIPVPPCTRSQQEKIVARWQSLNAEADLAQYEAETIENNALRWFLKESGIVIADLNSRPRTFAMSFNDLGRWGVAFNRQKWSLSTLLTSSLFPIRPLSEVAEVNPGLSLSSLSNDAEVTFVPMEAVSDYSGEIVTPSVKTYGEVSQGYTKFQNEDILWAKITPCMQNGKSAVASSLINGVGFGSTEFHVVRIKATFELLPEYVWLILRLPEVRKAATRYFIGSAGQQRVPADFLEELPIPILPKEIQVKLLSKIASARETAARKRQIAKELRETAKDEINATLLGISSTSTKEE
ncbi:restriction endonuclease subunit S [Brevibacillus fortis]|uniref:Type I restriction modification DNA specificity domain-containing protein n=1 Tax=Brevibacillus fortis TaxID=2126352 RepID=A0A2P7UJW8_9BACL|nr:restriction endonuclease subunit S [Brevibacillus fortis]PSJ87249.1 hypothetical protein C7R93_27285 [Brevibacillus fortis]